MLNLKRAIYPVVCILGFAVMQAYPQSYTPISGDTLNKYASVTAIYSSEDFNPDSVVLADATGFNVDDTVMIYCVKGATIGTKGDSVYLPGDDIVDPGLDAQDPRNTGKYAVYLVTEKIGNTLVLNASLTFEYQSETMGIFNMGPGEVAQLVRVRSFRYANVTAAGLTAPGWDPATGTGGIVALFVHGVLRLDGDIDVSGKGFRGAAGSTDVEYTNGCSSQDTLNYYEPFYLENELWAGLKGEGITDTMFYYTRGKASSINGGGGGNGLMAGGGGGSNASAGVRGGEESTACTGIPVTVTGGAGGFDLGRSGWYYTNDTALNKGDRIFFGGGGGSGTRPAGSGTTDGANGGGIVLIVADTILGNGNYIRADGGDVSGTAVNGAGGGGGAGGCIILEVAGYQSTLNLSAIGGDGGNTSGTDTTGVGGAGGGGIYWMSGTNHPGVTADNTSYGTNGFFESLPPYYPPLESPRRAEILNDLVAPLRGFVFNPVPLEFTYCSDVDPDPIVTSEPKGGSGSYTYQWIDSSSTQNYWADIPGAINRDYDPGLLSDTIYYRRILTSAGLVDTSFRISVYVHPAITGNTIAANDTVCSGNAPGLFTSAATIGGGPTGGTYTYKWQHQPDGQGSYSDLTAVTSEPTYQAPGLTTSTDYRRVAYSGVCVSVSNEERVLVLETLTGNDITPNDTICINTVPDLISGPVPSNGDQGDIRYQWLSSTSAGSMGSLIPGETGISYQSPSLSQTTYIRRVVLSGNDDACRDTSAYVEILNIPDITGNTISASQTVCQEDQPAALTGSSPGGGVPGQYSYTWISSTDQSSWVPATGGGPNDVMTGFDPGVMSGDTTWYRRVVGSGGQDLVCKDTSTTEVAINVLPSITNNVVSPDDIYKCQRDMPEALTGSLPGGGATVEGTDITQEFRWEVARTEDTPGTGDWTFTGAISQNYTDPDQLATDEDRWYQRIVFSGPAGECVDTSNLVHLTVHSEITANSIDVNQAICFNDSRNLRETALTGGENGITPVFTWRTWLEGQTSDDATDIPGSDIRLYEPDPYSDAGTLVYYYDRVVEIGACRDTSNAMQVTVMQLPGGELTDSGFDACEQTTALNLDLNMDGLDPAHFNTPWSVYLTDGVRSGIGPGSLDQDLDTMGIILDTYGADFATYSYEIESISYEAEAGYSCVAPPANLTGGPVVVNVARRPDPHIAAPDMLGETFEWCNDSVLLQFDPDNGTLSSWSEPAGSLVFSPGAGPNEYLAIIPDTHNDYGLYRIFIRSEAGDCAGLDSLDVTFFEQPAPAVARPSDTILWLVSELQLDADPPTAGTGTWERISGSGDIEDLHDPKTFVYGLVDGENVFRWTVINGENEGVCLDSDSVITLHNKKAMRYHGFSPNQDMENEYFIIQGLVYAEEFTITFFNSLGSTVRTVNNRNVGQIEVDEGLITNGLREDEMVVWDGRAENGNYVPSGTYYYVITYTAYQSKYVFKDYVVVVRE